MPVIAWSIAAAAVAQAAVSAPASWTDPATGHRIVRIDATPGNYGLYFNYNPFTPQGDLMIYLTPDGIRVVDPMLGLEKPQR